MTKGPKVKTLVKPSDPLIVDRWLDVAYISLWLCYGFWGVVNAFVGLPTVTLLASGLYQTVWSAVLGLVSLTAAFFAILVFFDTPRFSQVRKKRAELRTVFVLCMFIGVYSGLLIIRTFTGDLYLIGGSAILGVSYLIFPILRIWILRAKIKSLAVVVVVPDAP